jgi:hypothetical protein
VIYFAPVDLDMSFAIGSLEVPETSTSTRSGASKSNSQVWRFPVAVRSAHHVNLDEGFRFVPGKVMARECPAARAAIHRRPTSHR